MGHVCPVFLTATEEMMPKKSRVVRMTVYLAAVGHFALDMLLGHMVDQPVLVHEALVADPKKKEIEK